MLTMDQLREWRVWEGWCKASGETSMIAEPVVVRRYLAERAAAGERAYRIRSRLSVVGAAHRDARFFESDDPSTDETAPKALEWLARWERAAHAQHGALTSTQHGALTSTVMAGIEQVWATLPESPRIARAIAICHVMRDGLLASDEVYTLTWATLDEAPWPGPATRVATARIRSPSAAPGDLVFTRPDGTPLSGYAAAGCVRIAVELAGPPDRGSNARSPALGMLTDLRAAGLALPWDDFFTRPREVLLALVGEYHDHATPHTPATAPSGAVSALNDHLARSRSGLGELAEFLCVAPRSLSRWRNGDAATPPWVAPALRHLDSTRVAALPAADRPADALRDMLSAAAWSPLRFAAALGMGESTVQRWLAGKRRCPCGVIRAAEALIAEAASNTGDSPTAG